MIDAVRLVKFKRRAPLIATQEHLDRIMFGFPVEHHEEIAAAVQPSLSKEIVARKVEALPDIQFKDPGAPTLHESTVKRLNTLGALVQQHEGERKALQDQIAALRAELDACQREVKNG